MFVTTTRKGDIKLCMFSHFEAAGILVHAFTTRAGGVSAGPFSSLNMAFHVGDNPENVRINRALACGALGINPAYLVAGRQVHGNRIGVVSARDRGRGALDDENSLPDKDALITGDTGVPLSSYYADCVPVFLLDPVCKVIALAHAGWKGTVLKISKRAVEKMTAVYGTDPGDCLAGIGPSVGPCCYEVDDYVMEPLSENFIDWRALALKISPGKWRLDLWKANYHTLQEAGLRAKNIVMARTCTSCRNDIFFSYRAQFGTAGRMASLIMLK